MSTVDVLVHVTADDLRDGELESMVKCSVFRAIKRAGIDVREVVIRRAFVGPSKTVVNLPDVAEQNIRDRMVGRTVAPYTFLLEGVPRENYINPKEDPITQTTSPITITATKPFEPETIRTRGSLGFSRDGGSPMILVNQFGGGDLRNQFGGGDLRWLDLSSGETHHVTLGTLAPSGTTVTLVQK